jgi:hypothetical protein
VVIRQKSEERIMGTELLLGVIFGFVIVSYIALAARLSDIIDVLREIKDIEKRRP